MNITCDRKNFYEFDGIVYGKTKNRYEILDQIGIGGNAVVHECIDSSGRSYAIKLLLKFSKKIEKRFIREINLMKDVNHEHLIKFIDEGNIKLYDKKKTEYNCFFLIMEKADKNLLELIIENMPLRYDEYAPQFRGLAEALSILHSKALHRDIKPENILVKGETWLISDFGLCGFFDENENEDLTKDGEKIGPKFWMSPEAMGSYVRSKEDITKASDVYQLCAVFWFVVTKKHPTGILTEEDWMKNDHKIFEVIYKSLLHNSDKRPQDGTELYKELYRATVLERIS